MGSVAERMLRTAPVPMLTVSHLEDERHAAETGLRMLKRILYAADLSDSSSQGMKYAIEVAQQTGADLTVVTSSST
jgi:nucleotide-binding universal stress UspA family protein